MSTITVKNERGQVASFTVDGDHDPRALILQQRIERGDLEKVSKGTASDVTPRGRVVVLDSDTGVRDERGDLLKSVHGGGIDPDAQGDVLGQPTGSEPVDGAVEVSNVSAAAVSQAEQRPQSAAAKKAATARAEHQS